MTDNHFIEWRMVTGKLRGTLSAEEERAFREWYEASPGHRAYFERVKREWDGEALVDAGVDVEFYIRQFDERAASRGKKAGERRLTRWVTRVAAVLIPLVVAMTVLWISQREGGGEDVVVARLEAGKSLARLTLADGSVVVLGHESGSGVIEERGAVIRQEDGVLAYRPEGGAGSAGLNTIEIPRGGEYVLALSDGTRVWVNSGTRLVYPVCFTGTERVVELDGEAYFQVSRDTARPFIVRTGGSSVKVYGTSFNVNAYGEDSHAWTTLETGSVGVLVGGREYRLRPGEQADVVKESGEVRVREVNPRAYCSWHEGAFIFEEERLETILTRLSRWYNVEVTYADEAMKELHFTGDLDRYEDFTEVLSMIALTMKVDFVIENRNVSVKYK